MAIVTDPDNLDRNQVIFATQRAAQAIALYPSGALVNVGADRTDGVTDKAPSARRFTSAGSTFTTWGVAAGDILHIYNKQDAGHYRVSSVISETELEVETTDDFTDWVAEETGLVFEIREPTGGSIEDGVTLQAIYSFGKEEWKTDSQLYGGDDLIRHWFPFEPITREQMEIGGGATHDDWSWFDTYTKKKVRTGGWAAKNAAGTTLTEWTGVVTLGSLDSDTQAYYQQNSTTETPVNFTLLGPVNEAIKIWESGWDRRSYLKLFARKKARNYSQATISDIGVTSIETIVNRFPLSHAPDAAIVAADSTVMGVAPYRPCTHELETGSDGVVDKDSPNQYLFTSATATFTTNKVHAGARLELKSGTQMGYYTVESVDSETELTIKVDAEFTGWTADESGLSYDVDSDRIIHPRIDGALANVDGDTGTLDSVSAGFSGVVNMGDMVIITEAASDHRGVYKVISVTDDDTLVLNTSDKAFTTQSNIDFYIVEPGMYLQYKADVITNAAPASYAFDDSNAGYGNRPTITRADGTWSTDIVAGCVLLISSAEDTTNNGYRTVYARESATIISLVPTDVLVDNTTDTTAVIAVEKNFIRDVASVSYGFRWRLFGVGEGLANCFQFVQHELRQSSDINWGPGVARGDITDLLMAFASPTGTTYDTYIDNLSTADINNVTWTEASEATRLEPYVAAGRISFNANLVADPNAVYHMFFTNDDAGDNLGYDYGTPNAITVDDALGTDISGIIAAQPYVDYTYDYDYNVQRGLASAGEDAPITLVGIGLSTAQFVFYQGTITRSKANNFSLVSALERNYAT